jgi:hypothetical protein
MHGQISMLKGGNFSTTLQGASCFGNEKVMQMLIAARADINAQGESYKKCTTGGIRV